MMKRTILIFSVAMIVAACSKDPYELKINEFYRQNSKRSVRIEKLTLDTLVTYEQAKPWLEKKLARVKDRLKLEYAEQYQRLTKDPKSDQGLRLRAKEKLDSAAAGMFSPTAFEIRSFSTFLTEKPSFQQLTLKYKVWIHGDVREQIFISRITAGDTTLRVSDKGVKEYLMQ
jgi:hypothetical protein